MGTGQLDLVVVKEDVYATGRRVAPSDRLGSDLSGGVRLMPYGEEIGTPVANSRTKFATYYRDATGLDYADQRYYNPGSGRFMTADPYMASGGAAEPSSWNRFAYVGGDPVNFSDPVGLRRDKLEGTFTFSNDPSGLPRATVTSGSPGCEGFNISFGLGSFAMVNTAGLRLGDEIDIPELDPQDWVPHPQYMRIQPTYDYSRETWVADLEITKCTYMALMLSGVLPAAAAGGVIVAAGTPIGPVIVATTGAIAIVGILIKTLPCWLT